MVFIKMLHTLNLRILAIAFLIILEGGNWGVKAQRLSRDMNVSLLVNQVGYMPQAAKFCMTKGKTVRDFEVINIETQKVAYKGTFQPNAGDFGTYLTGDFSTLMQAGHYYIKADTLRSYPFSISDSIYQSPLHLIVHYFSLQRCGASTTGYLSPCHLDDGVRMDNGKHQDVTGGWHDASDLRKWVGATIYGMIGLAKTYALQPAQNRATILEELRWGNQYFLKMQEPQGYVMGFIGGDVQKHSDSNRWTDNEIGPEEGDLQMVKPSAGKSSNDMLIIGSKDDRVIQTDPLDIVGQYNFITAEALMAGITKAQDPDYAQQCLQAATQCFAWCTASKYDANPGSIGAAIQASLALYKTTGQDMYKDFAIAQAAQLQQLQANQAEDSISGFFYTSLDKHEPYKNISRGCLEFISLCDLIQTFPSHQEVPVWKDMIASYARGYLLRMSKRNSFGIIPFGLYTAQDPGGNRIIGDYWYRYFMQPELDWWVGINTNVASAGIGLLKAAGILHDQQLKALAQKQLDWIMGANPLNSSTIVGVGYNQPKHFGGSSFLPSVPVLPGAVMNGLGGDHADQPTMGDGNWQISEYWTPMVAYTLWLMAALSEAG